MTAPLEPDVITATDDIGNDADARREARMRALWAEAEAAIRVDVEYTIELAKEASRAIEFQRDREARRERARQASARGVATRAARKAAAEI